MPARIITHLTGEFRVILTILLMVLLEQLSKTLPRLPLIIKVTGSGMLPGTSRQILPVGPDMIKVGQEHLLIPVFLSSGIKCKHWLARLLLPLLHQLQHRLPPPRLLSPKVPSLILRLMPV